MNNEPHEIYGEDHQCKRKAYCDHEDGDRECLEGM